MYHGIMSEFSNDIEVLIDAGVSKYGNLVTFFNLEHGVEPINTLFS